MPASVMDEAGQQSRGPLHGVKIVELAGIGPGPMCAMLLADLGATVLRIDRTQPSGLGISKPLRFNLLLRNRHSISLDLKSPDAVELVLTLIEGADALIEGFRPGVTERLGLSPEVCLQRNPKLIYGRMTGWGQGGPLASRAGHDINYIAITGVLGAMGRADGAPAIPLNLVGDYAGGSLYLALGILAAILEAKRSGRGQVVDAAIVDGTAHLATNFFGMAAGELLGTRGTNLSDSGAYFYDVYECSDGRWISIGPIEPKFFAEFVELVGLSAEDLGEQLDRLSWPKARQLVAARFKEYGVDHWVDRLQDTDACFAPVLDWSEAPDHPHLRERGTFVKVDGINQPMPAPRFSRTRTSVPTAPAANDADNDAALSAWLSEEEIMSLRRSGTLKDSPKSE